LDAVLDTAAALKGAFSQDMFVPLTEGAVLAAFEVGARFDGLGREIMETFDGLGRHISAFSARLPGYFVGPLGQISGMFASMAASARASMNSISASARSALQAVSAVSSASRAAPQTVQLGGASEAVTLSVPEVAAFAVSEREVLMGSEGGTLGTASPTPPGVAAGFDGWDREIFFDVPDRETLRLPEPEVFLQSGSRIDLPPTAVSVTVHNENYIASEVDAEAVLREMEARLADAVASSMEGVYA